MSLAQRGRSLSVSGFLLAGAIGIISSTQTWLTVERADGGEAVLVPGASALVLLAPLSLAVLAGAASVFLIWSTLQLLAAPVDAVGPSVTDATGLAGGGALGDVVQAVAPTAWPIIALVGWVILHAASVVVLVTWRGWKAGGRRYRTDAADAAPHDGPVDAVDSWDELSRGTDPTR